jgi:glucose-1-phosphate thymidylyltransferase
MSRRGIILAGGAGTRLRPLTFAISKQLLPVYDKPLVYYPLSILMLAGIREILVITTPEDAASFRKVLGSGAQWGVTFSYAIQPKPEGIAQAYAIGADFVGDRPSCLVLGDNLLYGHGLTGALVAGARQDTGATVYAYRVHDPQRYGVVAFDRDGRALAIDEKPERPRSDWAVIGLYFYDGTAPQRVRALSRSARGEYEITDLNRSYLADGTLRVQRLGRGFAWFDAGTHASLLEASEFVRVIQDRQSQLIASPEEIAFNAGWITEDDLARRIGQLGSTDYARTLASLLRSGSDCRG